MLAENEGKVQYSLIRKKGMKSGRFYLRIGPDGSLLVTAACNVSKEEIDSFVLSKRAWWEKRLASKTLSHTYKDGDAFRFLGRIVGLELVSRAEKNLCIIKNDRLILFLKDQNATISQKQAIIRAAFVNELQKILLVRVPFWQHKMGILRKISLDFNNAYRMWACCRPERNEIRFSARAASLSPSLIDYLIVHELAHLRFSGHSPAFWAEVAGVLPGFREREEELKRCYLDSFL